MSIFSSGTKYRTISFGGRRFRVEVADSIWKISRGLSNRDSIPKDGGMLFVFRSSNRYGFWMLNMRFKLDIIWLDEDCRIVDIWRDAEPCSSLLSCRTVKPRRASRYVVELAAGTARKLGMRIGDRFSIG